MDSFVGCCRREAKFRPSRKAIFFYFLKFSARYLCKVELSYLTAITNKTEALVTVFQIY